MALSVASQNLGESLFLPQLPKGFQQLILSDRRYVSVRGSAVRGKTDGKKRFYDSVERTYAKKGSYFRRKDDVAKERAQERGMGGNVSRDSTQMKSAGYFRIFGVEVLLERDLGKDYFEVSDAVLESTAAALRCQLCTTTFQVWVFRSRTSKQVLFVELAGKDFVDTLLSFLLLPVSTIIHMLSQAPGCTCETSMGLLQQVLEAESPEDQLEAGFVDKSLL